MLLKYKLLAKKGGYPCTRSIRRLIRELKPFSSEISRLVDDAHNLHYVARLEEAYIASRYLPIDYEESEARDLLRFEVEVFKPLVEAD